MKTIAIIKESIIVHFYWLVWLKTHDVECTNTRTYDRINEQIGVSFLCVFVCVHFLSSDTNEDDHSMKKR